MTQEKKGRFSGGGQKNARRWEGILDCLETEPRNPPPLFDVSALYVDRSADVYLVSSPKSRSRGKRCFAQSVEIKRCLPDWD